MIQLPTLAKIEEIDFQKIAHEFKPTRKDFLLPRIAFIGDFRYLSMSCQRRICKTLGFEYYAKIPLGTADTEAMQTLANRWSDIVGGYTQIVVVGNCHTSYPEWRLHKMLYKEYKRLKKPIIEAHQIPVIMEEEIWKLHIDFPNIDNNNIWDDKYIKVPIQ
ncbi:MAG: hypothetical protein WBG37_14825 [Desulfobacterales bacterium]